MSRIRGRDTRPEMLLRRSLRAAGIGYRLHARDLPGSPDLVFRSARLVVFVHGCFWHRHPGCRRATVPRTRTDFWSAKFAANVRRDRRDVDRLRSMGWTVGLVWECEIMDPSDLASAVSWISEFVTPFRRVRRGASS